MSSLDLFCKFSSLSFQIWSIRARRSAELLLLFQFYSSLFPWQHAQGLGPARWVLCIYVETFCLCALLVLNILWEFASHKFSDCTAFPEARLAAASTVWLRVSVSTFCVPGVRCTRASSGLWSVLCSCSSLLTFLHCPSWLSLEDTHTAPGHPFLTVNCAPTGFPGCSVAKKYACNSGELGLTPGSGRSLEKGMATHSIILAWKTQRSEEPDRL